MKALRNAACILLALALGGCAVEPPRTVRYSKDGTAQQEFMKDRDECLLQSQRQVSGAVVGSYGGSYGAASSTTVCSLSVWKACLGARGYVVDAKGDLVAPPNMVVQCQA